MLLRVTADDVIAGRVFIHHAKEHFLDTRAFLVDGIIQRVNQMIHTLNDLLFVHHLCRCHIITSDTQPYAQAATPPPSDNPPK